MSTFKDRPLPEIAFPNYREECQHYLLEQGYDKSILLATFTSYMTGLLYCHSKPITKAIYFCLSDTENKVDSKAMGVYTHENKRVAYLPKEIAHTIREKYYELRERIVVLCYCTGYCTSRSAQCFYNVYRV